MSAAQAGIKLLVVLTEHIPAQDVMVMHAAAAKHGTRIVVTPTCGLAGASAAYTRTALALVRTSAAALS